MIVPAFVSELVRTIIVMSISGGLLALLLLSIKPIIRHRLPKSAQYCFWLVVLAAFLIPVSRFVVLPEVIADVAPIHNVVERNVIPAVNTGAPAAMSPLANEAGFAAKVITVFMVIYPFIVALVLLYSFISYIRFIKKLRRNDVGARSYELDMLCKLTNGKRKPKLVVSDYAATPMLIGVFRPMIVLPDLKYTDEQLQSILLHELTHMRRWDITVKWLSLLACAAHWFNPLIWITRRQIDSVCELSCDESVIRNMDVYGKQNYGDTLITVATNKKIPYPVLSTTMSAEKRALKERLTAIMKNTRHKKLAMTASVFILLAAVLTACVMGAGSSNTTPPADDTPTPAPITSTPSGGNTPPPANDTPAPTNTPTNAATIIGTWEDALATKKRTQGVSDEEFANFTDEERERYFEEFGTAPGITLEFNPDGTFSGNIWSDGAEGTYELRSDGTGTYDIVIATHDNIWTAVVNGDAMTISADYVPELKRIA